MKVKNSLIVVTAILLIVSTVAFSVFLSVEMKATSATMYETYLSDISKGQAVSLETYIDNVEKTFRAFADMPAVKNFTAGTYGAGSEQYDEAKAFFDKMVETTSAKHIIVYDNENAIKLAAGIKENVIDADSVCVTSADDFEPVISASAGDTADYTVSVKAKSGIYNVAVAYDQANTGVRSVIKQSNGLVFVVDPNGAIISAQTIVGDIDSADSLQQYAPFKNCILNAPAASTETTPCITDEEMAYITKTSNNWTVVANNRIEAAYSQSKSASSAIIGISVTLCVLFFIIGIILIITVTKPFYKISGTLLKISRGDHEARVEIMSKNEYGDIARVFNDIMDNIIVGESRYRTIIDMSDNIIFEWNFHNNEVTFSNNFNKKFSYRAPSDHFADSFLLKCKVHPDDAERYKSDLEKVAKGENFKRNEYRWKNIYGDYIWVLIRTATINDKEGNPLKVVGVIVDIDRAKKSENMLTARASFDSLTGVYNRETIESAINNEIELIAVRKTEFAILFVDIDDFKFYNDQYSHATGDQVLRFTATTIKNAIGENGIAGRYGGDEFIICLKNSEENDPALVAEQILNTLKDGFDSDSGDHLSVNVSIGISIIRDNSKRVEEIIGQADDAMYKIKKNGKSNYGFLDT